MCPTLVFSAVDACVPQGKLGGCTVISHGITLNYTTYYLSLGSIRKTLTRETIWPSGCNVWLKAGMAVMATLTSQNTHTSRKLLQMLRQSVRRNAKPDALQILNDTVNLCFRHSRSKRIKDKTQLTSQAVVKARQTDTYRYKLVWKVTTSLDLRVCVCRHVSRRNWGEGGDDITTLPLFIKLWYIHNLYLIHDPKSRAYNSYSSRCTKIIHTYKNCKLQIDLYASSSILQGFSFYENQK